MNRNKVIAIILAAGYSSRMGAFKATLPLGDETVIERIIRTFSQAGIEDIVVVGGYNIEELKKHTKDAEVIFNRDFDKGMFSSIKAGVRRVKEKENLGGFLLTPVDYPLITKEAIEKILENRSESFAVPLYMGKKGHPIFVPSCLTDEILSYSGEDGLKGITRKYNIERVETGEIGCVLDMDTPEDYRRICNILEAGQSFDAASRLKELCGGRKFVLIRHGQPLQHEKGKIFLGQTDVPLSEEGRVQALSLQKVLNKKPGRVYASSLMRAKETARLAFPDSVIIESEELMEMNLGSWDGRYIEDIKKEFPDEFRKRGENLFVYKTGGKAENFFDLQFRVMMELISILKEDESEEIVIVSHSGVIRCIENLIKGCSVTDEWERIENGKFRIIEG